MLFCRVGPAPEPTGEKKSGQKRPGARARLGLGRAGSHAESLNEQVCGVREAMERGSFASPSAFSSPFFLFRLFLFRLFLGSLFSLLFLFLFSFFLSPFPFSFFLSLPPSLFSVPFLLGPSAFLFQVPNFLFNCAALLGLGARSSAHGSPCPGKTTLAGGASLPMRAAPASGLAPRAACSALPLWALGRG